MMWLCHCCRTEASFLYRGLCQRCAPDLHSAYAKKRDAWGKVFVAFTAVSGKEPLDDWAAFEDFLMSNWGELGVEDLGT